MRIKAVIANTRDITILNVSPNVPFIHPPCNFCDNLYADKRINKVIASMIMNHMINELMAFFIILFEFQIINFSHNLFVNLIMMVIIFDNDSLSTFID